MRNNLLRILAADDQTARFSQLQKALSEIPLPREPFLTHVEAACTSYNQKPVKIDLKHLVSDEALLLWAGSDSERNVGFIFGMEGKSLRLDEATSLNIEILELLARRFCLTKAFSRMMDIPGIQAMCATWLGLDSVGTRVPLSADSAENLATAISEGIEQKCRLSVTDLQVRSIIGLLRRDYGLPKAVSEQLEEFYWGWMTGFREVAPWWVNGGPPRDSALS